MLLNTERAAVLSIAAIQERWTLNPDDYLQKFFTELESLDVGHGASHAISTAATGQLAVRLGAGDWYWVTQITLDDDPIKAAQSAANAEKYFPNRI